MVTRCILTEMHGTTPQGTTIFYQPTTLLLLVAFVVGNLGCPLSGKQHVRKGLSARAAEAQAGQSSSRVAERESGGRSPRSVEIAPISDRASVPAGMLMLLQPRAPAPGTELPLRLVSLRIDGPATELSGFGAPVPELPPPRGSA